MIDLINKREKFIFATLIVLLLYACSDQETVISEREPGESLNFYPANTLAPAFDLYGRSTGQHSETQVIECSAELAMKPKALALGQTPPSHLLITEISEPLAYNMPLWIELFNPTETLIHLNEFQLRSYAIGNLIAPTASDVVLQPTTFQMPQVQVPPKSYVTLYSGVERSVEVKHEHRDGTFSVIEIEPENVSHSLTIVSGDTSFFWSLTKGFVELVDKNTQQTVDFMRFGDSQVEPLTTNAWVGDAVVSFNNPKRPSSLARLAPYQDTDQSNDWSTSFFTTINTVNLVSPLDQGNLLVEPAACGTSGNNDDDDLDGIPDCAETACGFHKDMPFYYWGARPGYTDVFVQIDYMNTVGASLNNEDLFVPAKESMDKMRKIFWNKSGSYKMHVHFDVGSLYTHPDQANVIVPDLYNLYAEDGGTPITQGGELFAFKSKINFTSEVRAMSRAHSHEKRYAFFHYQYNVYQFASDATSYGGTVGLGDVPGNTLAVASKLYDTADGIILKGQTATMFHELGHNFNLSHGGDDDYNYKLNYFSNMNYLYSKQLPDNDYLSKFFTNTCNTTTRFVRSVARSDNSVDHMDDHYNYSYGTAPDIDTRNMSESNLIISQAMGKFVSDLNGDNVIGGGLNCYYSSKPVGGNFSRLDVMTDFNDWKEAKHYANGKFSSLQVPNRTQLGNLPPHQVMACE